MNRCRKFIGGNWVTWAASGCGRSPNCSMPRAAAWPDFLLRHLFVETNIGRTNLMDKGRTTNMSTLAAPQNATTAWNIDPVHSVAEFKVKHMMISNVKGQFTRVKGTLALDETDLTNSQMEASIEAASINTRDAGRDTHLKSADFFEAEKFPTLSFKSTRMSRVGDGEVA